MMLADRPALRGLAARAAIEKLLGQVTPSQVAAASASYPLSATTAAASALMTLLQQQVPSYTPGQGPPNPTVLAFQQAWNVDPINNGETLTTDGEYGALTQAALTVLGYTSAPAPVVLTPSGTPVPAIAPLAQTPGATAPVPASGTQPNWPLIGLIAVVGVAGVWLLVSSMSSPAEAAA